MVRVPGRWAAGRAAVPDDGAHGWVHYLFRFLLETVLLYEEGRLGTAAGYVALSVVLSLIALVSGLATARIMD